MAKKRCFPDTDLYCITASEYSLGRSNPEVVKQMLEAGIRLVQYREKDFSKLRKYRECLVIRDLCAAYGACFIVNDDTDLAVAVEANGVHLGQDDLPADKAREIVGERMLVGLSVRSPRQVDQVLEPGVVDYIGLGPVFATTTKKDASAPIGLECLDYAVVRCRLPIVAIGGINKNNVAEVIRHRADCVAIISDIVGAADIGERVTAIRDIISRARTGLL